MAHVPASARDALIIEHEPLVGAIARDFWVTVRARGIEADDFLQAGRLGLIQAAEAFNPEDFPDVPFGAFARRYIRRELRSELDRGPLPGTGLDVSQAPDCLRPLPRFEPLFGCRSFEPGSPCPHRWPIRRGSLLVCMRCHQTGWEHHPLLQREPVPVRRPAQPKEAPSATPIETRRDRRRRLFGTG